MHLAFDLAEGELVIAVHGRPVLIICNIITNVDLAAAFTVLADAAATGAVVPPVATPDPAPDAHLESAYQQMTELEHDEFDHGFNDFDDDPDPYQGTYSED